MLRILLVAASILFISQLSTAVAEDQKQEYQSCASDAAKLKNFIKDEFRPLNSREIDVAGIKKSLPLLEVYIKRFSGKECGNNNKFIGVIGKGKQHNFYVIGMRVETLLEFCKNNVLRYKKQNAEKQQKIKAFLHQLTEYVLEGIDRRV